MPRDGPLLGYAVHMVCSPGFRVWRVCHPPHAKKRPPLWGEKMFATRAKTHPRNPPNPQSAVASVWTTTVSWSFLLSEPVGHTLHSHLTTRDAEPSPRVAVERGHAQCDGPSEELA